MLVRFDLTPAGWFWHLADEQAGPFATYDEAVEHQREYQRWLYARSPGQSCQNPSKRFASIFV